MCGISGFLSLDKKDRTKQLEAINDALRHRGPDAGGIWVSGDGCVGLGHRRLSIIDLSPTGRQPMVSHTGRFIIVFNGEIYNFIELKEELKKLGHVFKGTSDTEVVLASFEQWGVLQSLEKFNGMFAVALWDQSQASLYLFRDRLGVKPLYYRWHNSTLYFSSELSKPFANVGTKEIDREALALYCRYNYVPAPKTIYKGIFKLMPGIAAMATKDSAAKACWARCDPYWDTQGEIDTILSQRDDTMGMEQAVSLLDEQMGRSIKQHMISDVPLGAFLSGGVDSSLVVAYMQKASRVPVRTFTIGFKEGFCDESNHAREIARYLGTQHTELIVTEKDALDTIPKIPSMYGEPFADSSQIPTFLVSQLTRQNITVALSGDGGDELFSGYKSYARLSSVQNRLSFIPPSVFALAVKPLKWRWFAGRVSKILGDQHYEWAFNALRLFARQKESRIAPGTHAAFSTPERMVLGVAPGTSLKPFYRCKGNIVEQKMVDDLMLYLPDDILTKVDRASMAVSLEVRAPFTDDYEILKTAWKIPFRLKNHKGAGKVVLKQALGKMVPREFFERPKMGFAVPLTTWVDGPLRGWVHDSLDLARIKQEGYLNPVVIKELLDAGGKSEWYAYKIWGACIFVNWLRDFHHN